MSYTIQQKFINKNRSGRTLVPQGIVFHDTDTPGATANNEYSYFNRVYVAASAHFFVDWNSIIQTIPTNEQAWHAGPKANHRFLSIEMCTPLGHNKAQFDAMYARAIWLGRYLMKKFGFSINQIHSHKWCSNLWHETDHQDPDAFLEKYGKTWQQLLNDLEHGTTNATPTVSHSQNGRYTVIARSGLRVRNHPGTNSTILGVLPYGTHVKVDNFCGDWASIFYGAHGGWVAKRYIK